MNLIVARALLEDAWRQVLDNWVFRLLAILVLIPILSTFLIGFHEDRIDVLFGVWSFQYDDALWMFGGRIGDVDPSALIIQQYQGIVVDGLAGLIGIIFCIAATAFFVPRMMEKGAADTLFAKPVSRMTLLLSRYVAGLIFVSVLATTLVFGMFAGFVLVSGYRDAGFLWSALTLVFVYALLQTFSIMIATLTRSTVAAILLTLALYITCGSIHGIWMFKEMQFEAVATARIDDQIEKEDEESGDGAAPSSRALPTLAEARAAWLAEQPGFVNFLNDTGNVLHFVLPKTTEAGILTAKLKQTVSPDRYIIDDEEAGLRIMRDPRGYEFAEDSVARIAADGAVWTQEAEPEEGEWGDGRITLRRRPLYDERNKRMTAMRSATNLMESLEGREELESPAEREARDIANRSSPIVTWVEDGRRSTRAFMNTGQWVYELEAEVDAAAVTADDQAQLLRRFFRGWSVGVADEESMDEWIMATFTFDAPWRYNLLFSIGSSIAFALAMFGIAGLKLRRTDF